MNARTLLNPNTIPSELRPYKQFVCWRYVDRGPDHKPDKVPVNCHTLGNAGVTWPNTWTDIRTAVATYHQNESLAGIAYVLTKHDPHVMIDLDNCIMAGQLSPFAAEIVDKIPTYWEYSPSLRGLRGFVYCEHQPDAVKRDEIEIYSKERFATLTGNVLHQRPMARVDSLQWLTERFASREKEKQQQTHGFLSQGATASQDDRELWQRITAFNSLARELYNGNMSVVRGNDPSRAVILLLNSLAKWTGGDAGRMRRMIEQTPLDKTKWYEKRGDWTWLDGRINDAIQYMGGR